MIKKKIQTIVIATLFIFSLLQLLSVTVSADDYDYIFEDSNGDYWYIKAITSGSSSWAVPNGVTKIDVMVVAGGGAAGLSSGSRCLGGGGGAGGLIWKTNVTRLGTTDIVYGNTISYSIGAGGVSGDNGDGGDSTFGNLTAKGGGQGGRWQTPNGQNGGSGGGGGAGTDGLGSGGTGTQPSQSGWSGIYGYGRNGISGINAGGGWYYPGGGGGADGNPSRPAGGSGKDMSSYFGTTYGVTGAFARGGNGAGGGTYSNQPANNGNGGHGRERGDSAPGYNGGSGIILVRWEQISITDLSIPNGQTNVALTTNWWNCSITDTAGNFNWSIEIAPDAGSASGTNETNGVKSCPIIGLKYGTLYTVYLNITGSQLNKTYTFETEDMPSYMGVIYVDLNPQAEASISLNQDSWSPSAKLGETEQTSSTWATLTNDGDVQVDVTIKANNTNAWTLGSVGHNQFNLGWLIQGSVQKYEYYSGPRDDGAWANPKTQTFTIGTVGLNEDFYVTKAVVSLNRIGGQGNGVVSINQGGPDLVSASLNDVGYGWTTFNFASPALLHSGQQYTLKVTCPSNTIQWNYGSDGYAGGTGEGIGGKDFMFEVWGYNSTVTNITTSPTVLKSDLPPIGGNTYQFGLGLEMPTSSSTNANQTTIITFTATAD